MKIIFLLLLFFFSSPVLAVVYQLDYSAYGMGLNLLSARIDIDLTPQKATLQTVSQTRGMLSFFLDSKTQFDTTVKINKNQYIIEQSSMINIKNKKPVRTVWNFEEKQNFIDYQTILAAMMHEKVKGENHSFLVSDGKRDMNITLMYQGVVELPPNDKMFFAGKAEKYDVSVDILSGKKKGWFFQRMKEHPGALSLYFARIESYDNPILVLGTFDTGVLGNISIYLSQIKQDHSSKGDQK